MQYHPGVFREKKKKKYKPQHLAILPEQKSLKN